MNVHDDDAIVESSPSPDPNAVARMVFAGDPAAALSDSELDAVRRVLAEPASRAAFRAASLRLVETDAAVAARLSDAADPEQEAEFWELLVERFEGAESAALRALGFDPAELARQLESDLRRRVTRVRRQVAARETEATTRVALAGAWLDERLTDLVRTLRAGARALRDLAIQPDWEMELVEVPLSARPERDAAPKLRAWSAKEGTFVEVEGAAPVIREPLRFVGADELPDPRPDVGSVVQGAVELQASALPGGAFVDGVCFVSIDVENFGLKPTPGRDAPQRLAFPARTRGRATPSGGVELYAEFDEAVPDELDVVLGDIEQELIVDFALVPRSVAYAEDLGLR